MYFYKAQHSILVGVVDVITIGQRDLVPVLICFLNGNKALKIVRVYLADIFRFLTVKTQHIICDGISLCNLRSFSCVDDILVVARLVLFIYFFGSIHLAVDRGV